MSIERPPDIEPRQDGFQAPPWGALGALVGLFGNLFLLIFIMAGLSGLFQLAGLGVESVASRYSILFLFQIVLLAAPTAAVLITASGGRALGLLIPAGWRMWTESAAVGVVLSALAWLYALGLRWFAPEAYESMIAEQQRQLELLAGPVPLLLLAAVVVAPVCEEVFFRAFFFAGLRSKLDFAIASAISALVFAFVHAMLWSTPPLFLVGLGMALLYERHRSVTAPIAGHAVFNGTQLLLAWVLT
jgi:hypothetical protein